MFQAWFVKIVNWSCTWMRSVRSCQGKKKSKQMGDNIEVSVVKEEEMSITDNILGNTT